MTKDQPSENVPLLMRISSPGDVPVSSNELSLSPSSAKSSTCLTIGRRIPHSLSAKFSCHPNVQTFPQISGSTSLRDRLSTSRKFSGLTIRWRSKPNSPMTLETCSNSPFEFPNSLKPLKLTYFSHFGLHMWFPGSVQMNVELVPTETRPLYSWMNAGVVWPMQPNTAMS